MDILCVGHLTFDDVILPSGEMRPDCPGGAALYSASGAFMCKHEGVGLISRLGYDYNIAALKSFGLDLSRSKSEPQVPTIHLFNMFDRKGLRYFIPQRWAGSFDRMAPRPEDNPNGFPHKNVCYHVAPFPLPRQKPMIEALPNGVMLSVDPHHDYIYPDQRPQWESLLKKITVFQPSEDELCRFFALPIQQDILCYVPYIRQLAQMGPQVVVTKLGERGALALDRVQNRLYHINAFSQNVVDVTGCGDCFCGGFMASYSTDGDITRALASGSAAASFNITHYGVMDNFSVSKEHFAQRAAECLKGVTLINC